MSELPIVLHVGAPKAGSSALQHELTWRPRRPLVGRPGVCCEYVAIDASGELLRGDALEGFAALFAARYCMSAGLDDLARLEPARLRAAAGELAALRAAGTIPVLSYELWLHAGREAIDRFASLLGAPLRVVAYLRDPVSWLRSLYWQRRRPPEGPRGAWVAEHAAWCRWSDHIARWRAAPGVERVDVRLADRSVPRDFAALLGFEPDSTDALVNPGVSGEFARFLARHRVGPALHVSEAKFAWSRWTAAAGVADDFDPTPAVFDAAELAAILAVTADATAALLEQCDAATAAQIRADARWWSADPALHAGPAPRRPPSAPVEEADRLLEAALMALVAADGAWRAEERRRRLAEARLEECRARPAA